MVNIIRHQWENSKGNYHYNINTYHAESWVAHFHTSPEVVRVARGTLHTTVGDRQYDLRAGDYAMVLGGEIHAFSPVGDTEYFIVVFSEDFVPQFAHETRREHARTAVFRCDPVVDALFAAYIMTEGASLLMKKAALYAVCGQYLADAELEKRHHKNDSKVGQVLDYIAENYRQDISLKTCAAAIGYEYHYLSRLLGQTYHINFRRTLNEYRLAEAMERLRSPAPPSCTEIALSCGFQSVRSFNDIVKRYTGKTPGQLAES